MLGRKLSRLASLLGAAAVATLTFAVVAHASGFLFLLRRLKNLRSHIAWLLGV
jgi:hypothetical protein